MSRVTSTPSPVSASTSRRSPSRGGSISSGLSTWSTISSEPVAASSRMTLSAAGSSRSLMRTTRPRPVSWAAACPAAERGDGDPILRCQPDVAEGGSRALGEQQLLRPSGRHGRARVDEDADGDVLLLHEELDEQALEPRIHVPVELAQVVAEGVIAVVGELHRLTTLDAPPAALEPAANGCPHDQKEALQLPQERLVEDGRIQLVGQEGAPRTAGGHVRSGAAGRRGGRGGFDHARAPARPVTRPPVAEPLRVSSGSPPPALSLRPSLRS